MFKIVKHKKKITRKVDSVVKFGRAFERMLFFILTLMLACHLIGCMWIYLAKTFSAEDEDGNAKQSWITLNQMENMSPGELYATSVYFTMQTLTTVGYGDILLATTVERLLCIFLQFIGVIFFSFASGSLTKIIANYDITNSHNQAKTNILNRILKDYHIPPKLYTQLSIQIDNIDDRKNLEQNEQFMECLPFRLKIRTIMYLYKESYEKIHYLNL